MALVDGVESTADERAGDFELVGGAGERGGGIEVGRGREAPRDRRDAGEGEASLALAHGVCQRDARQRPRAVQENGPRAAVALPAGDLRPRGPEVVSEGLGERLQDGAVDLVAAAVDEELRQRPPSG